MDWEALKNLGQRREFEPIIQRKIAQGFSLNDILEDTAEHIAEELGFYGTLLLASGRFEEAIHVFEELLYFSPERSAALGGKAAALVQLDRIEEALAVYATACTENVDYWQSWLNRAELLHNQGKENEALAVLEEFVSYPLEPSLVDLQYACGQVLFQLGRYQEAITHYAICFAEDPTKTEALTARDQALEAMKHQTS